MNMKKLLTILCLVLLSSYSYSKEAIPESEIGSRKGPPKAGTVTKKGPEGEMNRFDSSKGPQRVYKTVRERSYYNKRPYEKFYENGQLEQRGSLKNKEPDGLWEWFHKNGQLEQEEPTTMEKWTVSGKVTMKTDNYSLEETSKTEN